MILVCDPVAANRASTRSGLYALGYRHIEMVNSLDDLTSAMDRRPPDLVLCDIQAGAEALCGLVRTVRLGINQHNPFTVIMVTAWSASQELMHDIVNAGADDLLLRPFSTTALSARILAQTFRRRKFVITSGYVGPERREAERPSSARIFEPPNSLKIKAELARGADAITRHILAQLESARDELHAERLKCESIRLAAVARHLRQAPADGDGLQAEVTSLSAAIDARARAARLAGWERPHTQVLMATAKSKAEPGDAAHAVLADATLNLAKHFNPGMLAQEISQRIDEAVAALSR